MNRTNGRPALAVAATLAAASLAISFASAWPAVAATPRHQFSHEQVWSAATDDWEPAVAADTAGHVYMVTTRYGARPACHTCPQHFLTYRVSPDGGATWGRDQFLCKCPGYISGQNDPEVVTDSQGRVFVAYLNGFNVSFQRSDDFGKTWSDRREIDGNLIYSDKPAIAVSASGQDVYVVYNGDYGPSESGIPFVSVSHDAGHTWSEPIQAADSGGRYWFSGGATVTPDGSVFAAQDLYLQDSSGNIVLDVLWSKDGGATWSSKPMAVSGRQRPCPPHYGCPDAYLGAQATVSSDANGTVYFLYTASQVDKGPGKVYLRSSSDDGATWSPPRVVAPAPDAVDHEFPMIAATGAGDVRIGWMDDRTGAWNTVYRRSTDGGATWGPEVRLSDEPGGAPYKSPLGFGFPYGDYGQLAIDSSGTTWAVWGEGPNRTGPGGTWFATGV